MKSLTKSQEAPEVFVPGSIIGLGIHGEVSCERSDGIRWTQPNAIHATLKTYVSTLVFGASSATFPLTIGWMSLAHAGGVGTAPTVNYCTGSTFLGTTTFTGPLTSVTSGSLGRNFDTTATLFATTGFTFSLGASDSIQIIWKIVTG